MRLSNRNHRQANREMVAGYSGEQGSCVTHETDPGCMLDDDPRVPFVSSPRCALVTLGVDEVDDGGCVMENCISTGKWG